MTKMACYDTACRVDVEDPVTSDLTLLCEGKEFKVHQVIVCSQSNVLRAACAGNFKVYSLIDHYLGKNTDGSLEGINGNLQVRG
jgi:hypothetical protein